MANAKTYALYMELTKDTRGSQVLVIPPLYDSLSGRTMPAQIMTRKISEAHPRRSWSKVTVRKEFNSDPVLHIGDMSATTVAELVAPVVDEVGIFITGMAAGRWKMVKEPVMVELSFEDTRDIQSDKTPNALIRRIMKARAEAGYPATIWPVREKPVEPLMSTMFSAEEPIYTSVATASHPAPTAEYVDMSGNVWHYPVEVKDTP